MHSGVNKEDREHVLNDYSNDKFNVLLTTRVLDEGYNLPKINCCVLMASNSTEKQTIQRLGRVLRKKENLSTIYQIYVKGTFEEEQSLKKTLLFKELCIEYKECSYNEDGLKVL